MGSQLLVFSSHIDSHGSFGLSRCHTLAFDRLRPGPSWVPIDAATLVTLSSSLARSFTLPQYFALPNSLRRARPLACTASSLEIHLVFRLSAVFHWCVHSLTPKSHSGQQGHPCQLTFRPRGLSPPRRLTPHPTSTGLLHPVSDHEVRDVSGFPRPIPPSH